jgi:addiction module RelE/StbE family toxin
LPRVVVSGRAENDLNNLAEATRNAVAEAITRLAADPEAAGKKLLGRLAGLWVCRIGTYRLLYRIEGKTPSQRVIVLAIRHRSVAYSDRRRRR